MIPFKIGDTLVLTKIGSTNVNAGTTASINVTLGKRYIVGISTVWGSGYNTTPTISGLNKEKSFSVASSNGIAWPSGGWIGTTLFIYIGTATASKITSLIKYQNWCTSYHTLLVIEL